MTTSSNRVLIRHASFALLLSIASVACRTVDMHAPSGSQRSTAQTGGAQETPGDAVIAGIDKSVPIMWRSAVLVITPTDCTKGSERFELALFNPEMVGRPELVPLASAQPNERLTRAVARLLDILPSQGIDTPSFILFTCRRRPSGAMTGEAAYFE